MALRFISRSMIAYRLVVLRLACPSHWLIDEISTPDFSSAMAALWRMLCGCNRLFASVGTRERARLRYFARIYRTPKRVSPSPRIKKDLRVGSSIQIPLFAEGP